MLTAALMKYAVFSGRARRSEFWGFFLLQLIAYAIAAIVDAMAGTSQNGEIGIFLALTMLALFIPGLAVTVRRLHDTDKSGWLALIGLIPLVGGLVMLVFMLLDSEPVTNRYGPSPKDLSRISGPSGSGMAGGAAQSAYVSSWILSGFDVHGNRLRFSVDSSDGRFQQGGLIFGREPEAADLVISSSSVSRRHARIFFSDNDLWIEDLNSTNGTFLNGNSLEQGRAGVLSNGARLVLGDVELVLTKMV